MRCSNERERTILQSVIVKKLINVSFSCVCPVIDNEFRHNIVKVDCRSTRLSAIASWIQSYFDNVTTSETQGQLVGARKSLNGRARKRFGRRNFFPPPLTANGSPRMRRTYPAWQVSKGREKGKNERAKRVTRERTKRVRHPPPLPKLPRSFWPFPSHSSACHAG